MRMKGDIFKTFLALTLTVLNSCIQEVNVIDHSFEFKAEITYDDKADVHRLTLTRNLGEKENQYNISFTLDGENTLTLEDMDGRIHEGSMSENFRDVSARTYTISRLTPGEHTLDLEITTDEFAQNLAISFLVEDFSFYFDTKVLFNESSKTHSLEITLKNGAPTDTYTISYTVDNSEPRKNYQDTFTDSIVKAYNLSVQEPGEHTVNVLISTAKHSQEVNLPYTVNDYSFNVKADIEYDSENLSHVLFLSLLKGSRNETYTITYTVDGGHSVKLMDTAGKELGASFIENFVDATIRSYDLSRSDKGKHNMQIIISTKDYAQTLDIPYAVEALPFTIHAEMNTSGSNTSVMMLTLKDGDSSIDYNANIQIDGKTVASPKVNFSQSPIFKYSLPTTRPGKHDVSVELTDGYTVEKESVSYNEPVRHPYIDINLKYNENSGKHYAEIDSNPYDIELSFKTSLTITGKSTYCTSTYEYYYSDITYASKTKTLSDSNSSSGIYGGDSVTLIDRDALALKMTSSYEMSNIMTYFPGDGDGECVGIDEYRCTGQERAYYKITKEDLKIDINGEKVTGVTLRIKNNIGAMTLNGKSNSSGITNISL